MEEDKSSNAARELVLLAARTLDGRSVDVLIREGRISEVVPAGSMSRGPRECVDLSGFLLLPAPADPHAHLDTAYISERVTSVTGDLAGGIEAWLRYQESVPRWDFVERGMKAGLQALANGATAIRSHVGIYEPIGIRAVEALLDVREMLKPLIDVQLVALTHRLTGREGAQLRAMMRAALEMGVDMVGGVPHLDPEPITHQRWTLDLAAEFGVPIDLHTDETIDSRVLYLRDFAELVASTAFPQRATASHCVSLGVQPLAVARSVAEKVAVAGMAVICNPQTNLYLQGRSVPTSPPRGLTALRALLEAGVTVAAGSDNLRDPLNAVGRADPLETASLLVTAGHLPLEDAYGAVSSQAREAMGLPEVLIEPGYPAELLAVEAASLAEAIAGGGGRIVIHKGEVVARTRVTREYPTFDSSP